MFNRCNSNYNYVLTPVINYSLFSRGNKDVAMTPWLHSTSRHCCAVISLLSERGVTVKIRVFFGCEDGCNASKTAYKEDSMGKSKVYAWHIHFRKREKPGLRG